MKKSHTSVTTEDIENIVRTQIQALMVRLLTTFATKDDLKDIVTKEDLRVSGSKLDEKLDWLIGAYKKFDQEYTLISDKVSEHTDKIEHIEHRLGIVV